MSNKGVNETQKFIGYSDEPTIYDSLGIDSYYEGFKTFIENCNTPLTMAIQGDWGSGKTSALKLIEQKIDSKELDKFGMATQESLQNAIKEFREGNRKCHVIWFNTWQYANFGMDDNLILALLAHLNSELDIITQKNTFNNVKKILKDFKKDASETAFQFLAEQFGASSVYNKVEEAVQKLASLNNIHFVTQTIVALKQEIQKTILEEMNDDQRLVIFVDDLDRLEPKAAVDLLEGIKNLMDCKKCVFVLAIDAEVVYQGVSSKYGDSMNKEKEKMFFDKIIQVPFYIPMQKYDTKRFLVKEFLNCDGVTPDYYDKYVRVVRKLVGNNPRSIKRIFNLWELNKCIEGITDPKDLYNMFIFLSIETTDDALYQTLIDEAEKDSFGLFEKLTTKSEMETDLSQIGQLLELPDISYQETNALIENAMTENGTIEEEWLTASDQWNTLLSLLINTNKVQIETPDMDKFDFPESIKAIMNELVNTDNYSFVPAGTSSCTFEDKNQVLLRFSTSSSKKDAGNSYVNITIYNIHEDEDFMTRYDTLDYKFQVARSKKRFTIVNAGRYTKEDIKGFLTEYGISFDIV